MIIQHILTPERTLSGVLGVSKKKTLEFIAETLSKEVPVINASELFEALVTREHLGTTGVGNGVALPHCRFKACPEPTGLFIRLEEPIDFDSIDRSPVDLVFALIVPDGDNQQHLEILQSLAERFSAQNILDQLRGAPDAMNLFEIITADSPLTGS